MKKAITIVLILVLVLTCVACSSVDSVILSTSSCEIVAGETFELSYNIIPENADTSKLIWKSANEQIATVGNDGVITAQNAGETTVYLTNGQKNFASCTVKVLCKTAYDTLNEKERDFVNLVLRNLNVFKNPNSVEIIDVCYTEGDDDIESFWIVEVSAQNGFGGVGKEIYTLNASTGFTESIFPMVPTYGKGYNIKLINEAINEKR